MRKTADPVQRFWSRVDTSGGPDACWPWKRCRNERGYGVFGVRKVRWLAHRFAIGYSGPLFVCHRCDNPPCCNPTHLFTAPHRDNMEDMKRKGRSPKGSARPNARLTEALAAEAKRRLANGERPWAIAKALGIGATSVYPIRDGRTWSHA